MHVERTFTVARPVEEVFDFLADFTHTERWDPGTIETRRTGGDGGLGTTYANVSEFLGRRVELTYETTVHDRPHQVRFRGSNPPATGIDTMSFFPDAAGTRIHYRADFYFGPWLNPLARLFRSRLERLADETVERIRQTLR